MHKNNYIRKEMIFSGRKLVLETGKFAPQTNCSVMARWGDTVVLVAVVAGSAKADTDFFPLTCKYEERLYAGGLIKSSRWVKREGAPLDQAIIAGRLIDHAIRPLFPKDYQDEVNVIATVMSIDHDADPVVLAMLASSAALHASNIPWTGPMVSSRVSTDSQGNLVLNPSEEGLKDSALDLVVSLVNGKFVAMEADAHILPEEKIVDAVNFVHQETQELARFMQDFADSVGNGKYTYVSKALAKEVAEAVKSFAQAKVKDLLSENLEKSDYVAKRGMIFEELIGAFKEKYAVGDLNKALQKLEMEEIRKKILHDHKRVDGRGLEDIREIKAELSVLPRTHGSALFSRGITQALTVATLGSPALEQLIQSMYGEETKRYIHHYNGPQYSVGELMKGRSGPGSREVGHGMLAEKALVPVMPAKEVFPYTVRMVSEVISQSGSSSMASTCGSSLALMDAGVPIKSHVAGIAIGLMTDESQSDYVLITDLAYIEDAFGFMDFKMTGTRDGVTAVQVDIKLPGIPLELLPKIVAQSKRARIKILDIMDSIISTPKTSLSTYAPKMTTIKIKPEQIGIVIGSGGKTIRDIEAKSSVTLSIDDDGTITISGESSEGIDKAKTMIDGLTRIILPGEVYEGVVKRIMDFGAFVEILPGKEGLVHVSELSHGYVPNVRDIVKEGDVFNVKVMEIDQQGRINLSKKALEEAPANMPEAPMSNGSGMRGFGRREDSGGYRSGGSGRFRSDRSGGRSERHGHSDRSDRSDFNRHRR